MNCDREELGTAFCFEKLNLAITLKFSEDRIRQCRVVFAFGKRKGHELCPVALGEVQRVNDVVSFTYEQELA